MTNDNLTQEEQNELQSKRYGSDAFWVLPLSSGRIAVLTPNRGAFRVVDSWNEAKTAGPLAEAFQLASTRQRQSTERQLELEARAKTTFEVVEELELDL